MWSHVEGPGHYHQGLHGLDLALGTELFGGPSDEAEYPVTGDNSDGTNVVFDPAQYKDRAALLFMNGVVVYELGIALRIRPYTAGSSATTDDTDADHVLNVTPNGNDGAIWMAGDGAGRRQLGKHLLPRCQRRFRHQPEPSGFPGNGDYGNAFMKISTSGGLAVADYFEMRIRLRKMRAMSISAPVARWCCPISPTARATPCISQWAPAKTPIFTW